MNMLLGKKRRQRPQAPGCKAKGNLADVTALTKGFTYMS
jgi:hypothetical protein